MKVKKKTVINVLIIGFILSFFVTDLGYYGKVWLNKIFSFSADVTEESNRNYITDYDWKLKDAEWNFFNFKKSKGEVIFINFWASWKLPSEAELESIQELYDRYQKEVTFYIITNEERPPVEEFMEKHEFTFPITYLIIGEKMPVDSEKVPSSYIIDRKGGIVVHKKEGIADWDNQKIYQLLDSLIAQ